MSLFTALDHVALVVRDLDLASGRYSALLGRAPEWRGAASGAEHVWFQLANTALDIISPTPEGIAGGSSIASRLDAGGEGIWTAALATPDLGRAIHRLERVGVGATAAFPFTTTRVGGEESRTWQSSLIKPKTAAGASLLIVEQAPGAPALPPAPFEADESSAISGLDHIVVRTPNPERAIALYGGRLGLEMRLDRSNPDWGSRLMFFRLGDLVVEIAADLKAPVTDGPDSLWGLSWRAPDVDAARARMAAAGFDVSEARAGRKPGTKVFTVRDAPASVPTLIIGPSKDQA